MNLKERFENYESMPDEAVWQHVQKRLRRRKVLRYSAAVAMLAALIVMAVVAFWPSQMPVEVATPMVAKYEASPQQPLMQTEVETKEPVVQQVPPSVKAAKAVVATAAADNKDKQEPAAIAPLADKDESSVPQQKAATSVVPSSSTQQHAIVENREEETMVAETPQTVPEQEYSEPITEEAAQPDAKLQDVNQNYVAQEWVPNAFSPDDPSGGAVCTFKAVAKERANIKGFKMYIYNRAGALVFQSTDIDEAWDGTYRGQQCPAGNYVYIIELNDEYAGLQHLRGSILLIR